VDESVVKEIQGLYGTFSLSERVLQKIWLRGGFNERALQTASGQRLSLMHPGRWNLHEGPDFIDAWFKIGDAEMRGDVEVHFHESDWHQHDHSSNPNFKAVRLHVVLYPGARARPAVVTSSGHTPELLYLLPYLEQDLEEYAIDEALCELEQVDEAAWVRAFLERPPEVRRRELADGAQIRWQRKVGFSAQRLAGASWAEACHQACLEVLGYARNRAPMAGIALNYSIEDFAKPDLDLDAVYQTERPRWRLSGLRPANHPRLRLAQYADICRSCPEWPDRLRTILVGFTPGGSDQPDGADRAGLTGAAFRRKWGITARHKQIATEVFADTLSATRLNTLICDGVLPLAEAAGICAARSFWMEWPSGDAPESLRRLLKRAGIITREEPFANGQLQGAIQLLHQSAQ
jgi:hypothetical protein